MNTSTDERQPVSSRLVTDGAERLECLPRHFGRHMLVFEDGVYSFMRHLSRDYRGGFWQFYELSNGGFYMACEGGPFNITVDGNGFSESMSADAAGITACLFALSHLSFQIRTDVIANHFYQLREYAIEHPEARLILAAID